MLFLLRTWSERVKLGERASRDLEDVVTMRTRRGTEEMEIIAIRYDELF
jgi:hypothetical protein